MNNIETYKQSTLIEMFLRTQLKVKHGSRDEQTLKGFYESLVQYENGHTYMCSPNQHKLRVKRLLKYFEKAISKLSKKHPDVNHLRLRLDYIDSADGVLNLYNELKEIVKGG
ncbi:MAG: hypothetical protein ABJH72_04405 [Reichenbachiella sp.]|uniref:hypothetical protein n=1 Tax=Reichenbachiella sp. TaxID=2184521 RepID=UPI003265469A